MSHSVGARGSTLPKTRRLGYAVPRNACVLSDAYSIAAGHGRRVLQAVPITQPLFPLLSKRSVKSEIDLPRPLRVRARGDLEYSRQVYQGRESWVVKDPLALRYFRFESEELYLLRRLDGQRSAEEIRADFNRQFAPQQITLAELFQLVGMLHRNSLVLSDAPLQGVELARRARQSRGRQRRARWTNILSIQFRGFDPTGLLDVIGRRTHWLFTRTALILALLFGIAALSLVACQWETFQQRLPHFREFFAGRNWIWLAITLTLTKILHEFGHGVACRRFGGECHEMGVMFLVLTPCLYCNVSDSWTVSNKWHRMAVGAAGMYVELILASFAVFFWWFTHEGLIHQLALNTLFVCSVSTLVFNANPLMRYDGYYILSDFLEIPNLRQKSSTACTHFINAWFLGIPVPFDPFMPRRHRWLFALYAVAAACYRWVITLVIFLFLYRLLEPYGLKIIGQLLAVAAIVGLVLQPVVGIVRFFSVPGRSHVIQPTRLTMTCLAACLLTIGVLAIPLPYHVDCPLYVQAREARTIYIEVGGIVQRILARPNTHVEAGETLIELQSGPLQTELEQLEGQALVARAAVDSAQRIAALDRRQAGAIDSSIARHAAYTNLIRQRRQDAANLIVRAPIGGMLVAADWIAPPQDTEGQLQTWHGRLLEPRNLGAFARAGSIVGQIVPDPSDLEAVLAIEENSIEFVRPGQPVRIWIEQLPASVFESTVETVSKVEMKQTPRCLSSRFGGRVPTTVTEAGLDQPRTTTYQIAVPLKNLSAPILSGSSGTARIRVGTRTIGSRIWRWLCQTFRFEL